MPGSRGGEARDLAIERGLTVCVWTLAHRGRLIGRDRTFRDRALGNLFAREPLQPFRRVGEFIVRIDDPAIATAARMQARRRDDVTAVASGIETGRDPAGGRRNRAACT